MLDNYFEKIISVPSAGSSVIPKTISLHSERPDVWMQLDITLHAHNGSRKQRLGASLNASDAKNIRDALLEAYPLPKVETADTVRRPDGIKHEYAPMPNQCKSVVHGDHVNVSVFKTGDTVELFQMSSPDKDDDRIVINASMAYELSRALADASGITPAKQRWEHVTDADEGHTYRLKVPCGWLYRTVTTYGKAPHVALNNSTVFVPEA